MICPHSLEEESPSLLADVILEADINRCVIRTKPGEMVNFKPRDMVMSLLIYQNSIQPLIYTIRTPPVVTPSEGLSNKSRINQSQLHNKVLENIHAIRNPILAPRFSAQLLIILKSPAMSQGLEIVVATE